MEDPSNPYAVPSAHVTAVPRIRFWSASFAAATTSALVGVLVLYLIGERQHFGDSSNDLALLKLAFPQLLAVACFSGFCCSLRRSERIGRAAWAGMVVGPVVAFLAYQLYPLVHRWA
jgi:hypothetical protein